jgi:hypothetical protein
MKACYGMIVIAWLATLTQAAEPNVETSYTAYRFTKPENWHVRTAGDPGATRWNAPFWSPDFSQGASSIGLSPPDRCLLGKVDKIHLRARGTAKGHPVHLFLHTHFMTFHKVVGEFGGEGEQEIVTDGPPGPGWEWFGGENDGKIRGPLRVGEIRLEANGLWLPRPRQNKAARCLRPKSGLSRTSPWRGRSAGSSATGIGGILALEISA